MEEDLRTLVREFRASVSEELTAQHRRIEDFRLEVRDRIVTAERAILNTISDLSRETDRRLVFLEENAREVNHRLDSFDGRLDTVDGRLDTVDGRLDSIDGRLDSIDGRLDSIDGSVAAIMAGMQRLLDRDDGRD